MIFLRRAGLAAVLLVGLAGCGSTPAPAPAPTAAVPAPTSAAAPTTAASGQTPEQAACAAHAGTAKTVRDIASVVVQKPVLPAAVALLLLDARQKAQMPGVTDPALVVAETELVAAIDDLDAQGRAGLPAGGNPATDAVQLDATRILAAVTGVEQACAKLG